MKIVCDSCGAKYSIADEKVAGKVFKIRCKKCSEVIVVRGDQLQGGQEESTQVYDYQNEENASAVWHAVVNGDQQGPFAPEQLADMMNAGTIDWEVYVWREGFDNWLAARDVPELVAAITGQPAEQPAAAASYAEPQASSFGGGASAPAGGGLFAASASDSFGGGGGGGGADLFAQHDAASSPFEGGADDDVVASQPSPRVAADQAMTGQRNENSVLFSLSNLQALATGPAASPAPSMSSSAAKPGHASGEGSGLIDIRALASATGVGGGGGGGGGGMPAMGGGPAKKESVDDLLSIGTGAPMMGGLGAPILAPVQEEKSNKGLVIAIAAAAGVVALAAVAIIVILVTKEPEPIAQASGAPVPTTGTGAIAPGVGTDSTATPGGTTATPTSPTTAEPVTPTEPAAEGDDEGEEEERGSSGSSGSSMRRRGSSGGSSSSSSSSASSSGSSEPSSAAATMVTSMGGGDIDSLLDQALSGGMAPSMAAASSSSSASAGGGGNLPDTPSRDQVSSALRSVQGAVSSCGGGQHGVAMVAITVSGSSGRVTNANVSGQFAGTPVGSCVARAVRGAQFPRFRRPTFNVSFPYRI
jgi:predicted Zn finger-like uncharacterized protein